MTSTGGRVGWGAPAVQVDTAQRVVVEEQIHEVLLLAHEQRPLAAVEREAAPKLDEEVLDVIDQGLLELTLPSILGQLQEVEDVGVLGRFEQSLRVRWTNHLDEVRHDGPLTLVQPQVDLGLKLADRPAVCDRLRRIPGVEARILAEAVHQHAM